MNQFVRSVSKPPRAASCTRRLRLNGSPQARRGIGVFAWPLMCVSAVFIFTASQADAARRHSGRYLGAAERSQRMAAANVSREDVCSTLAASAQKHGLPVAFFGNLIYQESGLNPRVVSHVGARGIAQFMPGTARMVGLKNPFNPHEALPASAKFLRSLLHQFGNNYGLAAAAYNAGPGRIQRWVKRRTILPKETRDYVMTITGERAEHWRSIRGNHFRHQLARRMPCRNMPQFAHNIDEVQQLRGVVKKALLMMPRPTPAQQTAAVRSVSFIGSANAAPAPSSDSSFGKIAVASADPDSLSGMVPTAASSEATPAVQPKASQPDTSRIVNNREARETVVTRVTHPVDPPMPRANPKRDVRFASANLDYTPTHSTKHAAKSSAKPAPKPAVKSSAKPLAKPSVKVSARPFAEPPEKPAVRFATDDAPASKAARSRKPADW